MAGRIDTFQDLLDLLDAKPEWAAALRERILTPELLELPEKFAAFANMFADFADMVEKRFQALETDMTEVKGDVAYLKGHSVPAAAQRMMGVIAVTVNLRRPRWLDTAQIIDIADDAEDDGQADGIPENDMKSFKSIDLAMTGTDRDTRERCYVVIECSFTLTKQDADRALRNAGYMSQFTGIPAKALIAGNVIPEQVDEYAKELGVDCVLVTQKASAPV